MWKAQIMLPRYFLTLEKTMFQTNMKISNECHILDSDFHISNPAARIKMKFRNSTRTSDQNLHCKDKIPQPPEYTPNSDEKATQPNPDIATQIIAQILISGFTKTKVIAPRVGMVQNFSLDPDELNVIG